MVFEKGQNSATKRKLSEVSPVRKVRPMEVYYARLEGVLQHYIDERESFSDQHAIEFMVSTIKRSEMDAEIIAGLKEQLNDYANRRIEEAQRLKNNLEKVDTEDIVVDQVQDKMLRSISKMNEDGLDSMLDFLRLAQAKVEFVRFTSKLIHPEYHVQEIINEALNMVDNVCQEEAFEYKDKHRTKIRTASSSSSQEPPTMEEITQRQTGK